MGKRSLIVPIQTSALQLKAQQGAKRISSHNYLEQGTSQNSFFLNHELDTLGTMTMSPKAQFKNIG